jgi:hypothetical protein
MFLNHDSTYEPKQQPILHPWRNQRKSQNALTDNGFRYPNCNDKHLHYNRK